MALYRVDTVFPMFTGDPRDIVVNTLHFESTLSHEDMALAVESDTVGPFFRTIYGTTNSFRSSYIIWTQVRCRVFNLDDPTPRIPIESPPLFASPGIGFTSTPTEVACVASFQSAGLPGEVYQRRYNRIFLGAVHHTWIESSEAAKFPVFTPTVRTNIANAMKALQEAADNAINLWVQVSNAGGTTRTLPVIGGWVDNSPDTQRRRSVDATARTSWEIDEP